MLSDDIGPAQEPEEREESQVTPRYIALDPTLDQTTLLGFLLAFEGEGLD